MATYSDSRRQMCRHLKREFAEVPDGEAFTYSFSNQFVSVELVSGQKGLGPVGILGSVVGLVSPGKSDEITCFFREGVANIKLESSDNRFDAVKSKLGFRDSYSAYFAEMITDLYRALKSADKDNEEFYARILGSLSGIMDFIDSVS